MQLTIDGIKELLGLEEGTPEQKKIKSRGYQNEIKEKVAVILRQIDKGVEEYSNQELYEFIKSILQVKGWKNSGTIKEGYHFQCKTIIHKKYGTFDSNCFDEKQEYILESDGLPASFTFTYTVNSTTDSTYTPYRIERYNGGEIKFKRGINGRRISTSILGC